MNLLALLNTGTINTPTGASNKGSSDQNNSSKFQKHLIGVQTQELVGAGTQKIGENNITFLSAILSNDISSGNLNNLNNNATLTDIVTPSLNQEGVQTIVPEMFDENGNLIINVEGKIKNVLEGNEKTPEITEIIIPVQDNVEVKNGSDVNASLLGVAAAANNIGKTGVESVNTAFTASPEDTENFVRNLNFNSTSKNNNVNEIISNNEKISGNLVNASIKLANNETITSQLAVPEMKKTLDNVQLKSKDVSIENNLVQANLVDGKAKSTLIQQVSNTQNVGAELEKSFTPTPSLVRPDGVVPVFGNPASIVNEVVTERPVSGGTVITEKMVVEQLSNGLLKVTTKQSGKVVIKLTPEHLGQVEVTLSKKGAATTVRVVVDRAETLDIIRADIRTLERSLIDAGVDLRSNSINLSLRPNSGEMNQGDGSFNSGENEDGFVKTNNTNNNENSNTTTKRVIHGKGSVLNISV